MDDIADIIAQQGEIARRRKLLEAMQGQNMQTGIVGSNRGAAIGQALSKIATAYLLNQQGQGLTQEEAANRQAYSTGLQGALQSHLDMREGRPGQTFSTEEARNLLENDIAPGPKAEPVKADPRRAAISAMASQYPELQTIGKTEYAGLQKEQINPLDLLKLEGFDAKSKVAAALGGGVGALEGKREYKDANGQIYVIGPDGQPKLAVDARGKYGPTQTINGEAVQFEEGTGKAHQVATRPAQTNVSLNPTIKGEDAFASALGKDVAGEIKAARDQALTGYNTMSTLKQLQQLEKQGVFSGPVANLATSINAIAQTVGIPVDEAKLANSQAYQQQLAQQVAKVLTMGGGVGRSMTDEDRKAFEKSLPQLLLSPAGRSYVYKQMERDANIAIQRHQSMQARLNSNPQYKQWAGMLTINPVDEAPGLGVSPPTGPAVSGPPGAGGAIPLDQYLKSLGG